MTGAVHSVLIANRGEIALRVARAARDLGIRTVAVYSAADHDSRHRYAADRAVCLGPAPSRESYLRGDLLLHVALATGCDAVHPGYGFLSEDADFARSVVDAGLVWVGPDAATIERMGDKAVARTTAVDAGVPVVPGSDGVLTGPDQAREFGARHGYPMLLKARAGGGGKGMRVVPDEREVESAYSLASQEAAGAFGDGGVYAERYLEEVRHVEVQVVGDRHGTVRAVGLRDCSLQRRHQKVVEEAPAWFPGADRGDEMARTAVRLAESVDYRGAGTVEFLLDAGTDDFFFIEMNTRIQVEHPVTEETTGTDLVAAQLLVASGEDWSPPPTPARGHSIEFRITAEDPGRDFAPSPGVLSRFSMPAGPGVRVDTHCHEGYRVPPFYDSLLAKVVVTGSDRDQALARARRALAETYIAGIPTTLGFHRELLDDPVFLAGRHTTRHLARRGSGRADEEDHP